MYSPASGPVTSTSKRLPGGSTRSSAASHLPHRVAVLADDDELLALRAATSYQMSAPMLASAPQLHLAGRDLLHRHVRVPFTVRRVGALLSMFVDLDLVADDLRVLEGEHDVGRCPAEVRRQELGQALAR